MTCNFLDRVGEVPAPWRLGREWLTDMLIVANEGITAGDKFKLASCGSSTATFTALWAGCLIPVGAVVIETCAAPNLWFWDGVVWNGPFSLNDVQNEIRVVPAATPVSDFNAYFYNDLPPSTGAIVIVDSAPVRAYYSWNGTSWQQFSFPNVVLGATASVNTVVTNSGPVALASIVTGIIAGDLVTVGWNTAITGSFNWQVDVIADVLGTFTYSGIASGGYATGMHSFIAPANDATYTILINITATGGFMTFQERHLWLSVVRNL